MKNREVQFQNILNWFREIDYSALNKLDPISMALQISSRKVFRDCVINEALSNDDIDKQEYRNFEDYIADISISIDLYEIGEIATEIYMKQIHFWRLLREGKTIDSQLTEGEILFPSSDHRHYWKNINTAPIRAHTVGDEVLFRRIWATIESIDGLETDKIEKVFPEMDDFGSLNTIDQQPFIEYRKENPLSNALKELLPTALDAKINSEVNNLYREGEHRFIVDMRYPNSVIENSFKKYLASYRKQYSIPKPKNMTSNLMSKIISSKAIQYLDIDLMNSAFRYELTDIDKARIAFDDMSLDSNRFNQNIKPFIKQINQDIDVSLMAGQIPFSNSS